MLKGMYNMHVHVQLCGACRTLALLPSVQEAAEMRDRVDEEMGRIMDNGVRVNPLLQAMHSRGASTELCLLWHRFPVSGCFIPRPFVTSQASHNERRG
jgi:hypothetical protein